MDARLTSDMIVKTAIALAEQKGVPATVVRRGDARSGGIAVKLVGTDGFPPPVKLLTQARDLDGRLGWLQAFNGDTRPEMEADEWLARQIDRDEDLWVVEIVHKDFWMPFDGPVFSW